MLQSSGCGCRAESPDIWFQLLIFSLSYVHTETTLLLMPELVLFRQSRGS